MSSCFGHWVSPTAGDHSGELRRGQKLYRLLAFPNDGSLGIFHKKIHEKSQMFPVSHRFHLLMLDFWTKKSQCPFGILMDSLPFLDFHDLGELYIILIFPLDTPAIRESIPAPKKKILPLKLTAHP